MIGIHRSRKEAEFGLGDRSILENALPHLRRLFSVRSALIRAKAEAAVAHSVLDRLSTLALAIDRNGRVLAAYPENAESLLRAAVGTGFRGGRIHFRQSFQTHWEHLLAKATQANNPLGGAMLLGSKAEYKAPAWLEIAPAPTLPPPICAIVVVRAGVATPDVIRRRLRSMLKLTAAEADVAYMASQGLPAEEIAAARSVAVTTVRAQIRSIFTKVDVRSLSQLAALVARLSS
jgi:DNA-binding CsgD family transcriptional regulator